MIVNYTARRGSEDEDSEEIINTDNANNMYSSPICKKVCYWFVELV